MMLFSLCNSCLQPYRVILETSDIELVKEISDEGGHTCPCPRLCGGRINLVGDPLIQATKELRLREPMQLTGKELYRAVLGAGLPDEVPKSRQAILGALKGSTVGEVVLEEAQGRFYLHELHMRDGTVIHLAAGQRGAHVLKITEAR